MVWKVVKSAQRAGPLSSEFRQATRHRELLCKLKVPGPHLGEPPTEEQLLSSTSTRRSTTPRAARMCTMSVMPIVVCTLFVYAI